MRLRKISVYAAIALAIGLTGVGVLYSMGIGTEQLGWDSGAAPSQTNADKALDASGIKNIEVQVPNADIAIVPSDDSQIHVVLRSNLTNEQLQDRYVYTSAQNGDRLEVNLQGKGGNFNLPNGNQNIELDILVPKQEFDTVQIHSASGDGRFESLNAKSLQVDIASGDIEVKGYKGADLVANTKSGDVSLSDIEADVARVDVASGDLSLTGIAARVNAQVNSGDAEVHMKELREDVDISVNSGDVQLYAPKSSAFSFDLSTKAGNLENNFPGSNTTLEEKRHQSGAVGAGGPSVRLSSKSGDIRVAAE